MIRDYNDFVKALLNAGFSTGGGNDEGTYAVIPWTWGSLPPYSTPVCWHTGDPDTDPWEWRIRVLDQRDDIAYGKLFFKKSGYITKDWYPYFLAARREGMDFDDFYTDGHISHAAKRIYEVVSANEILPVHSIKQLAGFTREDKSAFDRALVELQMKMFLTICGRQHRLSRKSQESGLVPSNTGWASTVLCTTEQFFGDDVFEKAANINSKEAAALIKEQILKLNPSASEKKITKFIYGN